MREKRKWWQVLHGWANAADTTRDIKLAGFGAVVVSGIVWLTREQNSKGITDQWVNAFYGLCTLVGLGGAAMMVVDKIKGKQNAPKPQEPGTEVQEGTNQ